LSRIAAALAVITTACAIASPRTEPSQTNDAPTASKSESAAKSSIDDEHAFARAVLLAAINADRVQAGAPPVVVDSLTTAVAQAHATAMAAVGFFSHYGTTGDAPYERYASAGGRAHLRENVFQWRLAGWIVGDADTARPRFDMERVHEHLMDSPGHRATILDPHRTHIGIGIAVDTEKRSLVVVEDFIARHAVIDVPRVAWRRSPTVLRGRILERDARPLLLVLAREPVPREWVLRGEPPPVGPYLEGGDEAFLVPAWEIGHRPDGAFEIELPLSGLAPGRFYGVLYVAPTRVVDRAVARGRASTEIGWPAAAFMIEVL
jgi:uncharacterized protein YkwD